MTIDNLKLIVRVIAVLTFSTLCVFAVEQLDGYPDCIANLERRITLSCQTDFPDEQQPHCLNMIAMLQ